MTSPMQILIVDDETTITEEVAEYIIGRGACATVANRAEAALERLRANPGVTVLLSDIRMPGVDGLSLLPRALADRQEAHAVEVVLMTGHGTLDDAITGMQRKAFDFVRKPFALAGLWQTLQRAHDSATARRAMAAKHQASLNLNLVRQNERNRLAMASVESRAIQTDLALAITNHQLVLLYQPQVDLVTGQLCGAEALLRWNRPGHGLLSPDRFVSTAEDSGLIVPIGRWILREACRCATAWPENVGIAVNVSPIQFRDPGLYPSVLETIRHTGITPSRLELEITESVMLQDSDDVLEALRRLRELGVRLAMDDFGTGYCGLAYLHKFRFDKVKIDQGFTSRLGTDDGAAAIVRAVVDLSHSFGFRVIAEGVETAEQAAILRAMGCSAGQGYLYGRPIPGEGFALSERI